MSADPLDAILSSVPLAKRRATAPTDSHLPDLISFAEDNSLTVGSSTSGKHNPGSKHYTGNAIDIKGSGAFTDSQVAELSQKASERGLLVRDERRRPPGQKVWSAPHVHVEYAGGEQSSGDDLDQLLQSVPSAETPRTSETTGQTDDLDKLLESVPSTGRVTSTVRDDTGEQLPETAFKPLGFQEAKFPAQDRRVPGIEELTARKYRESPPPSTNLGAIVTAKLAANKGGSAQAIVETVLSHYGSEYVGLNDLYRQATGRNLISVNDVKLDREGNFSFAPSKNAIDFINAFGQGVGEGGVEEGLKRAMAMNVAAIGERARAYNPARAAAAPDIKEALAGLRTAKGSPLLRGMIQGTAPVAQQFGTVIPGQLGRELQRQATVEKAIGEQANIEQPLTGTGEQIKAGLGAAVPTAMNLGVTAPLGAAQLPVLGALQGTTPEERLQGAVQGAAMQGAFAGIPKAFANLPKTGTAVTSAAMVGMPATEAYQRGESPIKAIAENLPFAALPLLARGGREAVEIPHERLGELIDSPLTSDAVQTQIHSVLHDGQAVLHSEDGRTMHLKLGDNGKIVATEMPAVTPGKISAHDYNLTATALGVRTALPEVAEKPAVAEKAAEPPRPAEDYLPSFLRGKPGAAAKETVPLAAEPAEKAPLPEPEIKQPATQLGASMFGLDKFAQQDIVPAAKAVTKGVKDVADNIRELLAPATASPEASQTAGIVREHSANMARSKDIAQAELQKARNDFARQSDADNYDFIHRMETGNSQANAKAEVFAKTLRDGLRDRRKAIQALGTGKLENFIENYFPHIWKDPKKASETFSGYGKRPLEGSKSFLKRRSIPTTREGLERGLEPVSSNPVDLALRKMYEMDKYLMAHRVMREMKDDGLLKFYRGQIPEGWTKIDDRIGTVYYKTEAGENVISGHYAAPETAARVLNNYLSPGLERHAIYRGYRSAGNFLNQVQLSLSAFHAGFVTIEGAVGQVAKGLEELTAGHPLRAARSFAEAPIAPLKNLVIGHKMLKEWHKPGSQSPGIERVTNAYALAGGRAKMDTRYNNAAAHKMADAIRAGNPIGALVRAPFAGIELLSKPVMEGLVPRMKAGAFAELAKAELRRLGPDASHTEVRKALGAVSDSIDNRLGQMVYDNLFWNKALKDVAHGSMRSVGWNLGTAREFGGGVRDYASLPKRAVQKARGLNDERLFTHKMAYAASLPITVGLIGGVLTYLMTGKPPEEEKDYFFPRTGNFDEDGNPERISLPSYMKDVIPIVQPAATGNISKTVSNTATMATHKGNPLISMIAEQLLNKDYWGKHIRNEDDPLMQQLADSAKQIGKTAAPFSVQGALKARSRGASKKKALLPLVGITPAPKYVNEK